MKSSHAPLSGETHAPEKPSGDFRIAHLSDLHLPPLPDIRLTQLASKRLLALTSWHRKWKREHKPEVLDALLEHLVSVQPDHFCLTGDLTFTTLPEEVDRAADWIARLGGKDKISLIPGNHDAYVPGALDYALERWGSWMRDDDGRPGFPYLHRRGPVNIVGLTSALPTFPGASYGRLGKIQIEKARALISSIEPEGRPCLLLVHHPPQEGATRRLRSLVDGENLRGMLKTLHLDLILHGHLHRPTQSTIDCRDGRVSTMGAASMSAIGKRRAPAHYHLIHCQTRGQKVSFTIYHHHFDPVTGKFIPGERQVVP